MNLRVVFDTNVLFSAVGWHGNPARCLELAQQRRIQGVTCVEILDELSEKLSAKLQFGDEQIAVITASLLGIFEVVSVAGTVSGIQPDPDDEKILECAVNGQATHIVTGDKKHLLPIKSYGGVQIVTPADLLAIAAAAQG